MILEKKNMSKEDILCANLESLCFLDLSDDEYKWIKNHIVLEPNKLTIFIDDSYKDFGEDLIDRLSMNIGIVGKAN